LKTKTQTSKEMGKKKKKKKDCLSKKKNGPCRQRKKTPMAREKRKAAKGTKEDEGGISTQQEDEIPPPRKGLCPLPKKKKTPGRGYEGSVRKKAKAPVLRGKTAERKGKKKRGQVPIKGKKRRKEYC